MSDKISVVVPVYNVEKYLDKCLDSLVNQTYKNLEIIIVNDCTKDNSEKIINEYKSKYKNIVYIKNEKNSGLSFSRNAGMKKATGDYIGFIDSDDYVGYDYYESLYKTITENKADIAICDINIVQEETGTINRSKCGSYKNTKESFVNNGLSASAANKLFKRGTILYDFEVGKINEDIAVTIPSIIKAKKVVYDSNAVYNYIQRDGSIQNSKLSMKRFDIINAVNLTLDRIKDEEDYEDYKDMIVYNQIFLFLLYALATQRGIFVRRKLFKEFSKRPKNFNFNNNKYIDEHLKNQSSKVRLYNKVLYKLINKKLFLLASLTVTFYSVLKKLLTKFVIKEDITMEDLIREAKKQQSKKEKVSISCIVPNYNYDRFLYQRIYSILYQTEKISELIILDDKSKDDSIKTIDKICKELEPYISIKKVYNEKNSGSAFKQWKKGFELATSKYVWIAEADDYCDKNLIKELIKPVLKDDKIVISYADTAFVEANGRVRIKTITKEIDIMKTGHWNSSFINDGMKEIDNYSFLNCTIANVSSCIIKRDDYKKELDLSSTFKQAGDWIFYVNAMRRGKIAYSSKVLNYYRLHGNNVSSTFKKSEHIKEINRIYDYYNKEFKLKKWHKEKMKERIDFLKDVWDVE